MFRGRILVVSDRKDVIAELDPIIRAEGHLTLTVPNGEEALHVFDEGIIPDIVISDSEAPSSPDTAIFLNRFRQLNQLGQHLVVVETGEAREETTQALRARARTESFGTLPRPFNEDRVRGSIDSAMERIRRDLESLRAEMFREAARLQKAIREAQLEMVTALAVTMEAKDPYMRGHCERVAAIARRIATEMEVDEEHVQLLGTAALLHEIGKVGVPLELLHKNGALTADELAQVRAHPKVGAQIVNAVPSLRPMAILVENQYTDYEDLPEKISPDAPEFLLASILRIIDTYDAMTSERSYREVLPRERWESVLRNGSGTRFNPEVLDTLFRIEAELAAM